MGRKRVVRIPKSAVIKCPKCGKNSRLKMPDESLYYFECKKCKNKLDVPQSQCCMLCAYGNTECAPVLKRQASSKNLEIRKL